MSDEPKRITYLGTIDIIEPSESIAFDLPPDASPATIADAIHRANAERAEAQARESRELRQLFLGGESHDQAR
jgi:hypothetical protein